MKVALACDHAGFPYKAAVVAFLQSRGISVADFGTDSTESVDYPDYAEKVGRAVAKKEVERGILICGSGVGMSIAANKIKGVRAAVCQDSDTARQGVEHNNMNVLALGARVLSIQQVSELVAAFLDARFSNEIRYQRRVLKIATLEENSDSASSRSDVSKTLYGEGFF